jgi:DNA-binding CsgD family transcriptional regulator
MKSMITDIPKLLTRSELLILQMVTDNYSSRQIADSLQITEKTVENHRSNICKKLKISGQNALLIFALQNKNAIQYELKMNRLKTTILPAMVLIFMSVNGFAQTASDSVKHLLCQKSWHLMKLTDINTGKNGSGELFNIDTKFNPDGTTETTTNGDLKKGSWKLGADGRSLETDELKDVKSGQEKITIMQLSEKELKVQITYRGNNIMQFDYN